MLSLYICDLRLPPWQPYVRFYSHPTLFEGAGKAQRRDLPTQSFSQKVTELALDPWGLRLEPCFSSLHDLILGPLETITINKQKPSSHLLIHAGLRERLILGTRQSQQEQKFSQRVLFSPLGLLCLTTVSVTTSALYFYRIFFKACTCSVTECLVFGDERICCISLITIHISWARGDWTIQIVWFIWAVLAQAQPVTVLSPPSWGMNTSE